MEKTTFTKPIENKKDERSEIAKNLKKFIFKKYKPNRINIQKNIGNTYG